MPTADLFFKKVFGSWKIIFPVLILFFIVRLIFAVQSAKSSATGNIGEQLSDDLFIRGWQDTAARKMIQEIQWLEGQVLLAESDSISMYVDLSDSTAGIRLKGLPLLNTQIIRYFPEDYFSDLPFYDGFADVTRIECEKANTPKKPVKKIVTTVNKTVNNSEPDTASYRPLIWKFSTGNNIKVVIYGVMEKSDSKLKINPAADLALFFAGEFFSNMFPSSFEPPLFLWLPDKDARAIYRAMPENGKIIVRN